MERSCLEKLKEEAEAAQASLAKAEKASTMEHDTFVALEERSRKVLQGLFRSEPTDPAVTSKQSPAALLPELASARERRRRVRLHGGRWGPRTLFLSPDARLQPSLSLGHQLQLCCLARARGPRVLRHCY